MSGFAAMSKGKAETQLIFLASGDKASNDHGHGGGVEKCKWLNSGNFFSDSSRNSNESIVTSHDSGSGSFSSPLNQTTKQTSWSPATTSTDIEIEKSGENEEDFDFSCKDLNSALETLNFVHILYRDKMEWIEENIPANFTICPNSKSKMNLYQMWVEDLREQNQGLVEIIKDLDSDHESQIQNQRLKLQLKLQLYKTQKQSQDQESSLRSLTKVIENLRANTWKLGEEKESIKASNHSLENKNKHLVDKLNAAETEMNNLVQLLHRIRDEGMWNLEGITLSASTFSTLFRENPDLPGSRIVSTHDLETASLSSVTSFIHNEKCAELEALKEELEILKKVRAVEVEQPQLQAQPPSQSKASEAGDGIQEVEEFIGLIEIDSNSDSNSNPNIKDDFNPIEELARLEKEIQVVLEQNKVLNEDCHRERILRKHFYNLVEEMKGKIRVYCRVRLGESESAVIRVIDPFTVGVETSKGVKEYQFDRIFGPDESQQTVFNEVRSLVQSAFDGYNVCICAYGQTNTGKTHTILGPSNDPGVAPRCLDEIFSLALNTKQTTHSVISLYVVELYKQKLIDLLTPEHEKENETENENENQNQASANSILTSASKLVSTLGQDQTQNQNVMQSEILGSEKLEIKRDSQGIVYVQGAHTLKLEKREDFDEILCEIMRKRRTAETQMNQRSSRSHLVIGIVVENTSRANGSVTRGKLSLIDLAGSERNGNFNGPSSIFEESKAINKSLSALEHVIVALTTDQPHIPYRNSKLTELMQDSIGGNAKTLMIVNISPSAENVDESIVSLNYAARVKNVVNKKSVRNFEPISISSPFFSTPSQDPSQNLNFNHDLSKINTKTNTRNSIDLKESNLRPKPTPKPRPSKIRNSAFTAPPTPRSSTTNTKPNTSTTNNKMYRKSEIWTPRSEK